MSVVPVCGKHNLDKFITGKRWKCKQCEKEYYKKYYYSNKQKMKKKASDYYINNTNKIKEKFMKYYNDNKQKMKARQLKWREENKESIKKRTALWRIENPDKAKERNKETYKKWYFDNLGKLVEHAHARRARVTGNGGRYTAQEWRDLCDRYGNRCLACGATGKLSVDHVIPISKGGSNSIDNLQPLCKSCNSSKGTKTIDYRGAL